VFELLASELERTTETAGAAPVPELVTVADYARARSISESTVRAAIRDGRLPAVKIGRAVRVRAHAQIGESVPVVSSSATTSDDTPRARAARILGKFDDGGAR